MKKYLWLVALIIVVALIVFSKQIATFFGMNGSTPPPADGTPCTDAFGNAGTYTGGVCTATGGPGNPPGGPGDPAIERLVESPQMIFLPFSRRCVIHNSLNPYRHMGCSYVFTGYVFINSRRLCRLEKISCP